MTKMSAKEAEECLRALSGVLRFMENEEIENYRRHQVLFGVWQEKTKEASHPSR